MFKATGQKGFSLPELLIAGAIGCGVIFFVIQNMKVSDKANQKFQAELEDTANNMNMETMLRRDLTNAKHSLNNLSVTDDGNNKFFDYLSSTTCTSGCARSVKFNLSANEGDFSRSMYFIIINNAAGEQQLFNPADAYTRGTLIFNSLNYESNLSVRPNSPWGEEVKEKASLLLIYSPIEIFSPTSGVSIPGRSLGFMGWVNAANFQGRMLPESIDDGGVSYYDNTDLRTGNKIANEDEFFRVMPYTSGLGSFAFLTPVKVVRYRLKTVKEHGKLVGQLMRAELGSDRIFTEHPVGFNIKSFEFWRETISSPAIYVKMDNMN